MSTTTEMGAATEVGALGLMEERGSLLAVRDVQFGFAGPRIMPQVQRLEHDVFCDELGQSERSQTRLHVDWADRTNRYVHASQNGRVVGTMSISTTPPWSIAKRVSATELASGVGQAAEWRLFAVERALRSSDIAFGVFYVAMLYCRSIGVHEILVSAILPHDRLYERLGFERFGALSREEPVIIAPMRTPLSRLEDVMSRHIARWSRRARWSCPAADGVVS